MNASPLGAFGERSGIEADSWLLQSAAVAAASAGLLPTAIKPRMAGTTSEIFLRMRADVSCSTWTGTEYSRAAPALQSGLCKKRRGDNGTVAPVTAGCQPGAGSHHYCTVMCLAAALVAALGICTVNTPSLLSQRFASESTLSGSEKLRSKDP